MSLAADIERDLDRLSELSPSGFAMAFHVRFTTPAFLFQTYSRKWLDIYSQEGLVMRDPIVNFGFAKTGAKRWSELTEPDPDNVMGRAKDFDMNYGVAVGIDEDGSRSLAGLARPDREFTDAEIEEIEELVRSLHHATLDNGSLAPEAAKQLKLMSVRFTHPSREKD
ncbi:autoinducer binding domain-containing protein [Histidinibacterium aquaticum]|uniref:Transcriptional regulator n=1 Tax=Histidinibacterium aquaticum TaxID=2613962 RepID=A0A5J5GNX5_9RHOB|nr:autoinducer binding domain-containing protein [Histidinibacterium aquaticum]KAA9009268.1 transcriptional regulator [Histidinibacterium aquaticum]